MAQDALEEAGGSLDDDALEMNKESQGDELEVLESIFEVRKEQQDATGMGGILFDFVSASTRAAMGVHRTRRWADETESTVTHGLLYGTVRLLIG